MDASLRWRFAQHDKTEDVIPSISFVSFRAPARNPLMDASLRWRFVQHDKPVQSFRAFLLCHSERQRGIHSWMLRFAQHDKTEDVIPSISFVSFQTQ